MKRARLLVEEDRPRSIHSREPATVTGEDQRATPSPSTKTPAQHHDQTKLRGIDPRQPEAFACSRTAERRTCRPRRSPERASGCSSRSGIAAAQLPRNPAFPQDRLIKNPWNLQRGRPRERTAWRRRAPLRWALSCGFDSPGRGSSSVGAGSSPGRRSAGWACAAFQHLRADRWVLSRQQSRLPHGRMQVRQVRLLAAHGHHHCSMSAKGTAGSAASAGPRLTASRM